jgi:hypothetical protein
MHKTVVSKLVLVLLSLALLPIGAQAADTAAVAASPKDQAPLGAVMREVENALDLYQNNRGTGAATLPPLASAEFDFKATTSISEGVTVNFFIFKFGGSHQTDVTNDVVYTYALPKPQTPRSGLSANKKPPLLKNQLAQTIQGAAEAVKTAASFQNLPFSKLAVTIQYGVTWDGNFGISVPTFVTIGLNADAKKNSIQSVKLVFGQ